MTGSGEVCRSLIQSDLAITDLVITETLLYRTLFKALSSQSHLAITDKLEFWSFRYIGNLVFQICYGLEHVYLTDYKPKTGGERRSTRTNEAGIW